MGRCLAMLAPNIVERNQTMFGIATLIGTYIVTYVIWQLAFNYESLAVAGHPHYHEEIDPKGWFDSWDALVFAVTTVAVILLLPIFEFWPLNRLSADRGQPSRGLIATVMILIVSILMHGIFISWLAMPQVEYMVRVPVCLIFGTFLVNTMMQEKLLPRLVQPWRGLLLLVASSICALIAFELYRFAAFVHTGSVLGMGSQSGFELEIWVASAMLGVTFPIIFVVSGFFGFWPYKKMPRRPID